MTRELPIIFSGEMVRAIQAGRKTITRRVVRPQPPEWAHYCLADRDGYASWYGVEGPESENWPDENPMRSPYGKPGDRLYVRETWAGVDWLAWSRHYDMDPPHTVGYRADKAALHLGKPLDTAHWNWDLVKWKPSIHMPKWASRLWLEVVDVRVERVQDITVSDMIAEGIEYGPHQPWEFAMHHTIREWKALWDKINGNRKDKHGKKLPFSWDDNPWVWCISFKLLDL